MPNDRPRDPSDSPNIAVATQLKQVTYLPSPLHLYLRALMTSRKPARAQPMPPLAFERRNVPLDGEDIARYARLCGFAQTTGVPPTWPHLLAFPLHMLLMTDRAFPFAMLGMVHLANRIRQFATLNVSDRLTLDVRCGPLSAHDKGQVFTVVTTARRDDIVVWIGESLYLRTGVRDALGAPYQAQLSADPSLTKAATWPVPADLGRQYARISGDYNPIHLWPLTAKLFGFARPIIHGMWSFARTLAAVLPEDVNASGPVDLLVEFKTPVLLPGDVTFWRAPPAQPPVQPDAPPHAPHFELRDAAGTVPHLRGRWQALGGASSAKPASSSSSSQTHLPDQP
ncbi:MaoC family dehydratase [Pandoraea sputorum]|uniref:Acyl dehydratase n=1 Tax=Pandoraea sputorum TaxID=93222 RepID=A0A5E5AYT1_9BURK|nr:MaoC/PaaZ C-terminal domain-containing protein [Pandoraea sputorum]VVE77935.1 acyl dehydratase [Pandoraea sputorum]